MSKHSFTRKAILDRISVVAAALFLFGLVGIIQLYKIQILHHDAYTARAETQRTIELTIRPDRGGIFWTDRFSANALFPVAVDKGFWEVFVVPKDVPKDEADLVANTLLEELEMAKADTLRKLARYNDPYEPIKKKITDEKKLALEARKLPGLGFKEYAERFYPEGPMVAHVSGFIGFMDGGESPRGQYGLEEYFDFELKGKSGILETERDGENRPIGIGARRLQEADHGKNIVLTLDKTLQFFACTRLAAYIEQTEAASGTIIAMDPFSGAILIMCNYPAYDPNSYGTVENTAVFVNSAISHQYEPGSIFKPITMAAGLDSGAVTPYETYLDKGVEKVGGFVIRNAAGKVYNKRSMIDVLDYSINTGAIYVMRQTGKEVFAKYVENFGFGTRTGITLPGEEDGDISSLHNDGEIYAATASFGQGIAVTPLQVVTAFSAIANGGEFFKPYIVKADVMKKILVRRVISAHTASTLTSMLTSVIKNGHAKKAGVSGYVIAGKTGTAQVPKPEGRGYSEDTIHSFVGFGPVPNPAFVILVKLDNPTAKGIRFADQTTAPLFGEIAQFAFNYLEIPPQE